MRQYLPSLLLAAACAAVPGPAAAQDLTVGFENLATPLPLTQAMGLYYLNGASQVYEGITWDMRLRVVGADYRIEDAGRVTPLYGVPHAGSYYVTNEGGGVSNDGLHITTGRVLLGAWFGRNAYYGYNELGGADQVTIHALAGDSVLASVVFDLPLPAQPGQAGAMGFVDTGSFAALSGITGYRIDRRELGEQQGNWVADDFLFASAVPEPPAVMLLLAGLGALAAWGRRWRVSAAA